MANPLSSGAENGKKSENFSKNGEVCAEYADTADSGTTHQQQLPIAPSWQQAKIQPLS